MTREEGIIGTQVLVAHEIMDKWNLTPQEFVDLDTKYQVSKFVRDNFDYLNEFGLPGVLLEIKEYIKRCNEKQ